MMSPRVRDVLNAYQQQAKNALNLVNTTMLNNATASYQKVIAGTMSRVNAAMTNEQSAKVLELLNLKTGEVATGVTTRRDALRQALKEVSDEGITGFVDKAGKRWNADTYVNMNLRTTCGNVAMEAAFARNRDYGNDLISWPILANARPGCYPWQGKVCSTNNRSGTTTDLNGNTITIYPLNQTTFGEPDGIGGINCHHKPPNIFIPGLSVLRGEVPPKKENDAGYENTQTQRALERKVRAARRDQAMAEAANDPVAAAAAEKRSKEAVKELSAFTKQNDLTFRRDRIATQGTSAPKSTPSKAVPMMTERPKAATAAKPITSNRASLEAQSRQAYIDRNKATLGEAEAARRHDALVDGNTDAQLRNYIKKYGGAAPNVQAPAPIRVTVTKPAQAIVQKTTTPKQPAKPASKSTTKTKPEKTIKTRAQLEAEAAKVYIARNTPSLGVEEATRRAGLLAYANTAAQTRDYINKYGTIKVKLAKGVK